MKSDDNPILSPIPGVSIVVCCYNSASRLPQTLEHIAGQQWRPDTRYELIVVDNNSTDNTAEVAGAFAGRHPELQVQIVKEPNAGLSHARHAGFVAAQYEYVLLCDDDNWLAPGYGQKAYDLLTADATIGIVGGVGEAVSTVPIPDWFAARQTSYAVGELFGTAGWVKYAYGAGMCLRKTVYFKALDLGFQSLLTDRKGKELSSGGDLELSYLFGFMGYRIFQSKELRFKHFIDAGRFTTEYTQRLNTGFAQTIITLRPYDLVYAKRQESPGVLWAKEYAYLLKSGLTPSRKGGPDPQYWKEAVRLMAKKRGVFIENIERIRAFARQLQPNLF